MNRCTNCNVYVYESEEFCPLCKQKMEKTKESTVDFPKYSDIIKKKSPIRNLPLFSVVASTIICVYINIFTHDKGEMIWSVIVASSLFFALAIYNLIMDGTKRYGSKIIKAYLLVSVLLIVIDVCTGFYHWSINYCFPFLSLAVMIYLTILAVRSQRYFTEYFGYILAVITIDVIATIIELIIFRNVLWSVCLTALSSILLALGLYLFADKSLKDEVKKRFHR